GGACARHDNKPLARRRDGVACRGEDAAERDGVEHPARGAQREPKRPQSAWFERPAPARTPRAHRSNPNSRSGADSGVVVIDPPRHDAATTAVGRATVPTGRRSRARGPRRPITLRVPPGGGGGGGRGGGGGAGRGRGP